MKIKTKNSQSQQKLPKNLKFHYELLHKGWKKPDKFLEGKQAAYKQVLKVFLTYPHQIIYCNKNELIEKAGISYTSFFRVINDMISDGILARVKRPYKTTALRLSDYFFKKSVRKKILSVYNKKEITVRKQFISHKVSTRVVFYASLTFSFFSNTFPPAIKMLIKEKNSLFRNNHSLLGKKRSAVKKLFRKKRVCDSMEIKDETLHEIAQIDEIKLTRFGIVELLKFDPRAIAYARRQLPFASEHIRDKFRWFCKICIKVSKENDWPLYEKLYQFAFKAAKFLPGTTKTHEEIPKKKLAMYQPYKEPQQRTLKLEDEISTFSEYLKTPEAKKARSLGLLLVPPHLKEHFSLENPP